MNWSRTPIPNPLFAPFHSIIDPKVNLPVSKQLMKIILLKIHDFLSIFMMCAAAYVLYSITYIFIYLYSYIIKIYIFQIWFLLLLLLFLYITHAHAHKSVHYRFECWIVCIKSSIGHSKWTACTWTTRMALADLSHLTIYSIYI